MTITVSNPSSIDVDNESLQKTASATEQLVKLNKEASNQTKWLIILTIIITLLTLVMAAPIIIELFGRSE